MNPPEPRGSSRRSLLPIWLVALGGAGLSGVIFFLAHDLETRRANTEFIRRANIHQDALGASLSRHLESLHGVQKLMALATNLDRATFRDWARDIVVEHPEIQVVQWCPRVANADRASHEAAARQDGFLEYAIVERDRRGVTNLPAQVRAEYFPVLLFEPLQGNEVMSGLDVSTGQAFAELQHARDTGRPAASAPVSLMGETGQQSGLIMTLPVYVRGAPLQSVEQRRAAFRGVVRGVFRMRDLLDSSWQAVPTLGVETLIVDPSGLHGTNRFILHHGAAPRSGSSAIPTEVEFRSGRHFASLLRVGGRAWTLLFRPVPEWWSVQFSWLPYLILAGGLIMTALVTVWVRGSVRRTEMIESAVAERTAALSREVAERRLTEEELRKTQSTLVMAQRIGRVGTWELDVARNTLWWSDETFRIFGQDPEGFHPSTPAFFEHVHPEDREKVQQASHNAIETGRRYDVEHRVRRGDGSECFVHEMAEIVRDEEGKTVRMVGTVQDITERHYGEERLEWERNLLRAVIDNVPDYIFFKDREGRFIMNNLATQRVLGVQNADDAVGRTDADFLPAEVAMLYAATDARILETGQPIINQAEPLMTHSGEKRFLLTTKIPLKDARGQVTGIVGVCRDITERKRVEDEQQVLERKFQETQKLESLGVLAGGIAHDFNNLLTGILGNASLARMELSPESPLHPYLHQIEHSSQRAADLCKQMLAYSGKGRFVIQRIDLSALVKETLHLLQLSISKKASLRLQLTEPLPAVMADATQLRQIIMNLVMNASDAIGEKSGEITISTATMRADHQYLTELVGAADLAPGEYVVLEVTDNGCGMTSETRSKIFEPFFTTKFTGRGLGLAAVLGIVRGHKGAMKVYSELGGGSTFKLLLPAAGAVTAEPRWEQRPALHWRGEGTVLIIDDEESVRMVATKMLKALGFQVLAASDGEQGLRVYRAHSDRIAAVLLDLTMPRMDGEETFRELHRICPDVCVILMSGFNEQEAAARFVGKGLAGFLQKPFTPEDLRERLEGFGQRADVSHA